MFRLQIYIVYPGVYHVVIVDEYAVGTIVRIYSRLYSRSGQIPMPPVAPRRSRGRGFVINYCDRNTGLQFGANETRSVYRKKMEPRKQKGRREERVDPPNGESNKSNM